MDKISYYVSMPNTSVASIVINLIGDDMNICLGDGNGNQDLEKCYSTFREGNLAVVTPVIDSSVVKQVKDGNNQNSFLYLDKIIGYLINTNYNLLTHNQIEVLNTIQLNDNPEYRSFNDWFVKKYGGRIELVNYNPTEVGNVAVNAGDSAIANEVLDSTSKEHEEEFIPEKEFREPGFVSYILLGVIVAVISLVILYKLL